MSHMTRARSVGLVWKSIAVLGLGLAGAALPVAAADPLVPADPITPAPLAAPAPQAVAAPAPGVPAVALASDSAASITPADGMAHLPSPDSLPPGTTQTAPEHPTLDYLKDVWKALRTEEVTASDALLLLAQRPVNNTNVADSVPQSQSGPAAPSAVSATPPASAPLPDPVSGG